MTNPAERTLAVELTETEVRAIRLALIFGAPDPLPQTLQDVRAKLTFPADDQ